MTRCITVFTKDYDRFSDVYEEIINTQFEDEEEKEIDGITFSSSGDVPDEYIERMKEKQDVAVMNEKKRGITIVQHGEVFEIFLS
ncbi:conserved hypothetical protein [[Clostridium] ultunense Esp]|uniref:hypothetical protein n=1 Tax=Thermicanus aegyptius TaxID=94009 RepID=UPI0002B704DF|nr:hypothetical protein [Thermicanus aegyptius]CCQ96639.1 conserved hypothetical protein [[Clostridium] ultunense Esp]